MSLITRMRRQTAVWWSTNGVDGYGAPKFLPPVQIKCRWEDVREEFLDSQGQKVLSRSVVYVDRDMKVGDMLLNGVLTDLITNTTPKDNSTSYEIRAFHKLPTLKNKEVLKTAFL